MKTLFLRRSGCLHSDRAEAFLRSRFAEVIVISSERAGGELDGSLLDDAPDVLLAFRSHIIVRPPFIERIPLCLNFHPGPPERRGSGCVNFAIASGDDSYGSTCHHIDEQIDHGPIVDVRRFPIASTDGVAEVLARTYDYMLCQFYDVVGRVASGLSFPVSSETWSGPLGRAREMNALREIGLTPDSRETLERRIRATSFESYQPYVILHGKRFVFTPTAKRK